MTKINDLPNEVLERIINKCVNNVYVVNILYIDVEKRRTPSFNDIETEIFNSLEEAIVYRNKRIINDMDLIIYNKIRNISESDSSDSSDSSDESDEDDYEITKSNINKKYKYIINANPLDIDLGIIERIIYFLFPEDSYSETNACNIVTDKEDKFYYSYESDYESLYYTYTIITK